MRAAYQILSIPYRIINRAPMFCIFCRADSNLWQFIAGGGEDGETPIEAAKHETLEEIGIEPTTLSNLPVSPMFQQKLSPKTNGNIGIRTPLLSPNMLLHLKVIQSLFCRTNIVNIDGSLTMKQESF